MFYQTMVTPFTSPFDSSAPTCFDNKTGVFIKKISTSIFTFSRDVCLKTSMRFHPMEMQLNYGNCLSANCSQVNVKVHSIRTVVPFNSLQDPEFFAEFHYGKANTSKFAMHPYPNAKRLCTKKN